MVSIEHGENQWIEKISNINNYINQAFSYTGYRQDGGPGLCEVDPGSSLPKPDGRSTYKIVDLETGIELSAQQANAFGSVQGYFSNSNLYYAGMEIRGKQLGTAEDRIEGLSATVFSPNGAQVATGYIPFYYKPTTVGIYTVKFNNYGEYYFTTAPITDYKVYSWGGEEKVSVSSTFVTELRLGIKP